MKWRKHAKPVTIHDMAKMLNVSPATVSRVVSNSSYPVSPELSKKIKTLAKELGYTPNAFARQLKTKNSMTIGVVIPSISNPFYADVVLGIEEIARKHGYQVLLCNTQQDSKFEAEYLQTLLEKPIGYIAGISGRVAGSGHYAIRFMGDTSGDSIQGNTYEFMNGKQLVRNFLKLDDRPTAILTCNDMTAFGIINELNAQGIDEPGQISVIGFDNIELSQMITPPLTMVDHSKCEMGKFSCNMLMEILNDTPINVKEIVLQPKLIVRNSVGSP